VGRSSARSAVGVEEDGTVHPTVVEGFRGDAIQQRASIFAQFFGLFSTFTTPWLLRLRRQFKS
jgi:hypothetical protein